MGKESSIVVLPTGEEGRLTCRFCPKPISINNRSGCCKSCYSSHRCGPCGKIMDKTGSICENCERLVLGAGNVDKNAPPVESPDYIRQKVLDGEKLWHVDQGDCIEWLDSLPADCANLMVCSPPYEVARTYGINFSLKGQAWVDWMVRVVKSAIRVVTGPVVIVCEGQTRNFKWSATPVLLMADLHRAGITLRKPPIFKRFGIPGSGGPDWFRNDYEFCIVATRGGKLPWSDATACGQPPLYGPGGAMSNRQADGSRVNQWGAGPSSGSQRRKDGQRQPAGRPSHLFDGGSYSPPALANPGNIIDCGAVGGNHMGSRLAHENEAPYPEKLVERFILSFCPPKGLVLDCFSGSGTTAAAAVIHGRRCLACDIRESQVEIAHRRVHQVTAPLPYFRDETE